MCNTFTPTRNALDLTMRRSNKEHKFMKEHEDIFVAVVEKHALDGANTFILMKHKHKGHTPEWRHQHYYDVVLR